MSSIFFITCGLLAGLFLFWRLPRLGLPMPDQVNQQDLPHLQDRQDLPDFSVIIPMRNEAANIGLLLQDIAAQVLKPREVICIDDGSEDDGAAIARRHGATVLAIRQKPSGWLGKSYACHYGASSAHGQVLVFLDADVRLAPGALQAILAWQKRTGGVISVQPYHRVKAFYEQFSLFFNLVLLAGSGIGLPFGRKSTVLFGPVIAVGRRTYSRLGSHEPVKNHVLEDVELGRHYARHQVPCRLFTGGSLISFTMYGSFHQLWQGWTKNFFAGAVGIPVYLLMLIFLLLTGYASTGIVLPSALYQMAPFQIAGAASAYVLSILQIGWTARKIGNFHPLAILAYPLFLWAFCLIFLVSAGKKLILRKVRWKGRDIPL